jgi:uncharacterized protein YbjT (DUF2867 family)
VIVLAGGTGNLGRRIASALVDRGAEVRALVRPGTPADVRDRLAGTGATLVEVDLGSRDAAAAACSGATCVVSALNGLREVIVDAQTVLLEGAVAAGVPRFIPSDFAADFTQVPAGRNRNFDLRREFKSRLDAAPIAATSILNGAFADMLTDAMPILLFRLQRVVYFGSAEQPLDFTTMDDTAAYTAAAALDPTTPRTLRIAGDVVSAADLAAIASQVTGTKFRLLRAGSLGRLASLIRITRTLFPQNGAVFPAWQGMQYMHNMFSGQAKLDPLDNARYPDLTWTTVREVLTRH